MYKHALNMQERAAVGAGAGMASGLLLEWLLGGTRKEGRARKRVLLALLGAAVGGGAGALLPVDKGSAVASLPDKVADKIKHGVADRPKAKSRLGKVLGGAGKGALAGMGIGGAAGGALGAVEGARAGAKPIVDGAVVMRARNPVATGALYRGVRGAMLGLGSGALYGGIKGALDD